jgi:hypothetical protein
LLRSERRVKRDGLQPRRVRPIEANPSVLAIAREISMMSTKFARFVAAVAILASIAGNTGFARAASGAAASGRARQSELPRAPQPKPIGSPAFLIPPATSLGVQFVHVATAANSSGNVTVIDHPLTNGHPNAIILVTPNFNPGHVGGTAENHPIGVYYVAGQWTIFYQDHATIPLGAAFNVIIPTPGANVFVQTATVGNSAHDYTSIDNPLTNGNLGAIVFVTPNYNPGGGVGGTYDNHPIGVYYSFGRWTIFNQDGAAVPLNAAFNVLVYNHLHLPLIVR